MRLKIPGESEVTSFRCPVLILPPDTDQLHGVQKIIQGVGAIPELVLPPHAGGDREKEECVNIRRLGGKVGYFPGGEVEALSSKKS